MNNEKIIYVKIDPGELVESKKEMLSSEACMIKILQIIKKYHGARMKELRLKTKLSRELRGLKNKIKNFETTLPESTFHKTKKINKHKNPSQDKLSLQLEEIQKKLEKLEK